jgi:hypothetical protein
VNALLRSVKTIRIFGTGLDLNQVSLVIAGRRSVAGLGFPGAGGEGLGAVLAQAA